MSKVKERTARALDPRSPARGKPGINPRTPRRDNVRPPKQPWGPRQQPGWLPSNPPAPTRPVTVPWKRTPTVPEVKRFIRRHRNNPGLDKLLRPWIGRMPPARALEVLDDLYDSWRRDGAKLPYPVPNPLNGWTRTAICYNNGTPDYRATTTSPDQGSLENQVNLCVSGQINSGAQPIAVPYLDNSRGLLYSRGFVNPIGAFRHALTTMYRRPSATNVAPKLVVGYARGLNPNTERYFPGMPDPALRPPDPDTTPQANIPLSERRRIVITQPSGRVQRPIRPHARVAPDPGTKEGKFLSKTARLGIALFKILDGISETAEVIDAIYEALPDSVKERWNQPKRPGDSFGQYGLEGADWKLRALYHNFDKIDFEQAFKNLVKNGLQDELYGAIHKQLPRNEGNAHDPAWKALEDWMEKYFYDEIINN